MHDRPRIPALALPGFSAAIRAAAEDEAAQARLTAVLRDTTKIDTTSLGLAVRRIADAFREMQQQIGRVLITALEPMIRYFRRLREEANAAPKVAGMEGKFYVRAALTDYDPDADPRLVQRILAGDPLLDFGLVFLTPENRRLVAVAAIRGLSELNRDEDDTRGSCDSVLWGTTRRELVLL